MHFKQKVIVFSSSSSSSRFLLNLSSNFVIMQPKSSTKNKQKKPQQNKKKLETAPFAKGTGKVRRMEEVTAFLVKKNLLTPVIPNRNLSQ